MQLDQITYMFVETEFKNGRKEQAVHRYEIPEMNEMFSAEEIHNFLEGNSLTRTSANGMVVATFTSLIHFKKARS